MKLEVAIEILERRVASPFVRANTASLEATKLGILALKQLIREREKHRGFWGDRLPGETT